MEQLEQGQLASPASTAEMQRILRQQFYRSRLPRDLGGRAAIGHKTGDWPPLLANDVGILYPAGPGGLIVIAVFTNNNRGDLSEVEATEGRLAVDVLNAWAR